MDADSPFVVRLLAQRAPHRFIDASVGDVVAVPARGPLRVGFDGHCGIRHEKLSEYEDVPPQRKSHTLSLEIEDGAVVATPQPSSVVHFDDAKKGATHTRKPKVVCAGVDGASALSFGPATDLRMRVERRGARAVAERSARIRELVVDDAPASTLFFRRAVTTGAHARTVTALVAIGAMSVMHARRFVMWSDDETLSETGDDDAMLVTFEDEASVGVDELFAAMSEHGEPPSDDLVFFVVETCAREALKRRAFGLDGLRIRIRDGAPRLSLWANSARSVVPGHIVARAMRRAGGYRDLGVAPDENASARDIIKRMHERRTTSDADARAQLASLVRAWFPWRVREHEDFCEQAGIIDPARIGTWQVPDAADNDEDLDDHDDYAPW